MQVVVESLLTEYERAGKGKAVLILHGWADSSKGWKSFQQTLEEQFEVIVPDLPGFGGTQLPQESWGLNDYASFIEAFLKKIRVNPYAIIGHSNGAAIAIRGLAEGKLHAEKLVLLNSAGIRNQYKGRTKAIRIITKAGKALSTPLPSGVKKNLRKKVYKMVGSDMLVVENLQETFKRVVTDDIQGDAAKLRMPTLLIYGEDDLNTPVQYGRLLHNLIDKSQLEILPGAGHFVHLDKPGHVIEAVQGFLA